MLYIGMQALQGITYVWFEGCFILSSGAQHDTTDAALPEVSYGDSSSDSLNALRDVLNSTWK